MIFDMLSSFVDQLGIGGGNLFGIFRVDSPLMNWETFASGFYDRFISWSVRDGSHLWFESLRQSSITVSEYEIHFCPVSSTCYNHHSYESERVH